MRYLLILLTTLATQNGFAQTATNWQIANQNKAVSFTIGSLFGKVEGTLQRLSGTIRFSPDQLSASRFDVALPVATLDTDNDKRDEHLMNADWFDATQFPKISFRSERIERVDYEGQTGFIAHGKLDIHGTQLEASLPFTFEPNNDGEAVFEGALTVNRLNFGVGKSDFKVKDDVQVNVRVVGKRQ